MAGAVITRQRPGTAKGFVFLTLEDETGIANIIVRPDLFTEQRATIVGAPYLLVEGHAADPGRGDVGEGRARPRADRRRPGAAVARFPLIRSPPLRFAVARRLQLTRAGGRLRLRDGSAGGS